MRFECGTFLRFFIQNFTVKSRLRTWQLDPYVMSNKKLRFLRFFFIKFSIIEMSLMNLFLKKILPHISSIDYTSI